MLPGHATVAATARYAGRFRAHQEVGFYRTAQLLTVSNIGVGIYLGEMNEDTDRGCAEVVGASPWSWFTRMHPSLNRLAAIAREAGDADHHFRFIQLPLNLAMPEAFGNRVDGERVLDLAARLGITAVASASLLQSRLARNLPSEISEKLPGVR